MLQTFQRRVFSIGHMRNQIMSSFAKYIKQFSKICNKLNALLFGLF